VSAAATSMAAVPMGPFGVVTTGDGRWAFVSLTGPRTIGVLKVAASPVPSLIRQVPIAAAGLLGEALTPGDRYLLVANDGSGADVLSVQELEQGSKHPLVGTLAAPAGAQLPGSIEVAVSPDGDFVFASLEEGSSIAVFNLRRALSAGFNAGRLRGVDSGVLPRWPLALLDKRGISRSRPDRHADGHQRAHGRIRSGSVGRVEGRSGLQSGPGDLLNRRQGGVGHRPCQQLAAGILSGQAAHRSGSRAAG
jgi:hypothetical protein